MEGRTYAPRPEALWEGERIRERHTFLEVVSTSEAEDRGLRRQNSEPSFASSSSEDSSQHSRALRGQPLLGSGGALAGRGLGSSGSGTSGSSARPTSNALLAPPPGADSTGCWTVKSSCVRVRKSCSMQSEILGLKYFNAKVNGILEGDWLKLTDEPGCILVKSDGDHAQEAKGDTWVKVSTGASSSRASHVLWLDGSSGSSDTHSLATAQQLAADDEGSTRSGARGVGRGRGGTSGRGNSMLTKLTAYGINPADIQCRQQSSDSNSNSEGLSASSGTGRVAPPTQACQLSRSPEATVPTVKSSAPRTKTCGDANSEGSGDSDPDLDEKAFEQEREAARQQMRLKAMDPEELGKLMQEVPLDSEGNPTSIGSIGHSSGQCSKACMFVRSKSGCNNGTACPFCHLPHARERRKNKRHGVRPCKGKRDRYRKLVGRLEEQLDLDPDSFDMEGVELPPSIAADDTARSRLFSTLQNRKENVQASRFQDGQPNPAPRQSYKISL